MRAVVVTAREDLEITHQVVDLPEVVYGPAKQVHVLDPRRRRTQSHGTVDEVPEGFRTNY